MTKEKKILLSYLLKQYKQSIKQSIDDELENDIEIYFKIQKQLQTKKALIQQQLDQLETMDKSLKTRFTKIQDYMEKNNISQKKVKAWVARLNTVAKYKRVSADYKQMWAEALKKVNEATRRILQQIKVANEQTKRAATKIELQLVEQSILDIAKSLFVKFVGLFKAFDNYQKVSNSLPQVDIKQSLNKKSIINETLFYAFYNNNKIEIEAKDLWDAKQKAIIKLKVPKSKLGLLAVVSAKSQENQDFKFN